jgi:hypothetical protein
VCQHRWCWCDALYMAPPTWAGLSRATNSSTYLDRADAEHRATTEYLLRSIPELGSDAALFLRDSRCERPIRSACMHTMHAHAAPPCYRLLGQCVKCMDTMHVTRGAAQGWPLAGTSLTSWIPRAGSSSGAGGMDGCMQGCRSSLRCMRTRTLTRARAPRRLPLHATACIRSVCKPAGPPAALLSGTLPCMEHARDQGQRSPAVPVADARSPLAA